MIRRLAAILAICGAEGMCQDAAFDAKVRPVLSARCVGCHNPQAKAGGLSLDGPQPVEVWTKVRDRLAARTMPPPVAAAPTAAERDAVLGWIEKQVGQARSEPADPGRVTARRLNRTEYNNTIRDLLGRLSGRPTSSHSTTPGYGFDNIGDVLSVSPLLMEKLLTAAGRVSRAAVYGESYPKPPSVLVKIKPKRSQDDSPVSGDVFPYSMRGALFGVYHFPADGQYEFRWRYSQSCARRSFAWRTPAVDARVEERDRRAQPRRRTAAQMVFTIDGKQALQYTSRATRITTTRAERRWCACR